MCVCVCVCVRARPKVGDLPFVERVHTSSTVIGWFTDDANFLHVVDLIDADECIIVSPS